LLLLGAARLRCIRRDLRADVRLGRAGARPREAGDHSRRAAASRVSVTAAAFHRGRRFRKFRREIMKAALHALAAPAPALPAYVSSANECALCEHAWRPPLPVLLKGATAWGQTR